MPRPNLLLAVLIHIAISLGLSFSVLQMVVDGPAGLLSSWHYNFGLLQRGLRDPSLRYYTLVVAAALLAVPIITGLLDWHQKRHAGTRAASALGIGLLVLFVYGFLIHAPDALGMTPRLTIMAGIGIRFTSIMFVAIWVVINMPFAILAGWLVDRLPAKSAGRTPTAAP